MNIKRVKYFTYVLVLIVLMLTGCEDNETQPVVRAVDPMLDQTHFVEGAISKIMTKMYWEGEIAGRIRTRRSLAVEILKDHYQLMAYFISQRTAEMELLLGDDFNLYTIEPDGSREPWTGKFDKFWEQIYEGRQEDFEANNIRLEIVLSRVELKDVDNPTSTPDCRSEAFSDFRVVYEDEKTRTILLEGRDGTKRCHSGECPWDFCEF